MTSALRPSALALFFGDIVSFYAALWLALFLRTLTPPPLDLLRAYLAAFTPLFVVWTLVFFMAGLYEGRRLILAQRALSTTLLYAQTVNVVIAALFFFLVPTFGIAPKTVLLIYLAVSFLLVLTWRALVFPRLGLRKDERAIVVGSGPDLDEVIAALSQARLSPVTVAEVIRPAQTAVVDAIGRAVHAYRPNFIIVDLESPEFSDAFPELYNLLATGIRFIDVRALYEDVFGRVSLSSIDNRWVARNVSRYVHRLYDPLKRLIDIFLAGLGLVLSLVLYPFIMLAIYVESGTPLFISQERVGEGNMPVRLYKFRTMTGNDNGVYSNGASALRVTAVGRLLRMTRLDELPQLWNVVCGDLSLIGPRPEFPSLVAQYERDIPYYGMRHLIRPGLSGWAQLYHDNHPHHGTDTEATREKLSYDLYYLKHRSLALDAIVVLKTVAKMLTRSGA